MTAAWATVILRLTLASVTKLASSAVRRRHTGGGNFAYDKGTIAEPKSNIKLHSMRQVHTGLTAHASPFFSTTCRHASGFKVTNPS